MNIRTHCRFVALLLTAGIIPASGAQMATLKPVSEFSSIADPQARSVALFVEASRVLTSPRCLNCHPATREVTQGDNLHPHMPLMSGGRIGAGMPGLPCRSCHGP